MKRKPVVRGLRLRPSQVGSHSDREVKNPIVSIEHGYLWIGGEEGPCLAYIRGRATLRKIARLLREFAR